MNKHRGKRKRWTGLTNTYGGSLLYTLSELHNDFVWNDCKIAVFPLYAYEGGDYGTTSYPYQASVREDLKLAAAQFVWTEANQSESQVHSRKQIAQILYDNVDNRNLHINLLIALYKSARTGNYDLNVAKSGQKWTFLTPLPQKYTGATLRSVATVRGRTFFEEKWTPGQCKFKMCQIFYPQLYTLLFTRYIEHKNGGAGTIRRKYETTR